MEKISIFPKGETHNFGQKIENFYKKILGIFFDGVLNRKESFLDYQSVILTKSKKISLFPKRLTLNFSPKIEISP